MELILSVIKKVLVFALREETLEFVERRVTLGGYIYRASCLNEDLALINVTCGC